MINRFAVNSCPKCAPRLKIKKYTQYGLRMHLRNVHKMTKIVLKRRH